MRTTSKTPTILLMIFIVIPLLSTTLPAPTHAYTDCDGVQTNDVVIVDYAGYIAKDDGSKGEEFDSGDDVQFTVKTGRGGVIQGFYEGLLGMKIGERKEIIVPPSKGYQTGELAGETLIFDTFLEDVVSEYRECGEGAGGSDGGGFGSFLWKFLGWTAGIAVVGFIGVTLYFSIQKTTTPKCTHCSSQNRSRLSDGKCGKCGNYYCRQSFSRGCPNCKSNSFVPHDR